MRAETARPARIGWKPHEVALVAFGFVLPLSSTAQPSFLAAEWLKLGVLAVTCLTLAFQFIWTLRAERTPIARYMAGPVLALIIAYGAASAVVGISADRWALFAFMAVAAAGWWVCERDRPGAWLRVVYIVSVLHLALAAVTNVRTSQFGTGERLTGGTSPVLLGLEAACVIVVSLLAISRGARRLPRLLIVGLAVYVLFAAFSRASLISLMAAAVVVFVFWTPRYTILRLFFGVVAFVVLSGPVLDAVIGYLSNGNAEGFLSATGRYGLWQTALGNFDSWATGYGYSPLRGDTTGEETLRIALNGLPVENAPIQALFTAGIVGALIWLSLFLRTLIGLLRFRHLSRGLVVALGAPLTLAAIYSVGLAAGSFDWWWMLGALSLINALNAQSVPRQDVAEDVAAARSPISAE